MNKILRFQVFQRDSFTCSYCGQKPPQVVLEVDHIIPISKEGKDELENLITACFNCNRGKSDKNLSAVPENIKRNLEEIKERQEQLKEFYTYQQQVDDFIEISLQELNNYWESLWDNNYSLDARQLSTIRRFLKNFSKSEVKDFMGIAVYRVHSHPVYCF